MILLTGIIAGLLVGQIRVWQQKAAWKVPAFRLPWLVPVAFLPQLVAFSLPQTRSLFSDPVASCCLIVSQVLLFAFCVVNLKHWGIKIIAIGLALNLIVIIANKGFMPISTETLSSLLSPRTVESLTIGKHLGPGSKDVLLSSSQIILPWLADRFVSPAWLSYRFAFSLGDVLIAIGGFVLLGMQPMSA